MVRSTHSRYGLIALTAAALLTGIAAPARSDARDDRVNAILASGRRAISVHTNVSVTRPADTFSVQFVIHSGIGTQQTMAARQEKLEQLEAKLFDTLRQASLPVPTGHEDVATQPPGVPNDGRLVYMERRYRLSPENAEQAEAVRRALSPLKDAGGSIGPEPALRTVDVSSYSVALTKNRDEIDVEVRQKAMRAMRAIATENAGAIGMKLGPPLWIDDVDWNYAGTTGVTAHATAIFELIP